MLKDREAYFLEYLERTQESHLYQTYCRRGKIPAVIEAFIWREGWEAGWKASREAEKLVDAASEEASPLVGSPVRPAP